MPYEAHYNDAVVIDPMTPIPARAPPAAGFFLSTFCSESTRMPRADGKPERDRGETCRVSAWRSWSGFCFPGLQATNLDGYLARQ